MTQSLRPIGDAIGDFLQALAGTSPADVINTAGPARSAILARMETAEAMAWQGAVTAAQMLWDARARLPEGETRAAFSAALAHADELLEHLVERAYGGMTKADGKAVA